GPNGAGKTTTMRMLTGFIPPTSGTASIAGHDVFAESLAVRRDIGYLPENVPMYPEMRVEEYLKFRAKLKGVPRRDRARNIAESLESCNIADVRHRIIGQLSKGYRQRVGLADTLVHDPKILILDEPTIGLDPNQIRQIRALIKEIGKTRTVLLSTHILPEVEMVCGRVIIINKGRIVAMDTPDNLMRRLKGGTALKLEVKGPAASVKEILEGIPGIKRVTVRGDAVTARFAVETDGVTDVREEVFRRLARNDWPLLEMSPEGMSLEDIFVQITTEEK
ncbi:MAG: ATP-binding cassette domain-containing protein, partial [Planctomycetota bacterium]